MRFLLKDVQESDAECESFKHPTITERIAKKRKKNREGSAYIGCNFILGSVAEVERVWSIAKYVLSEQRRGMTPQMFEAIMFLRYNERL